MVLMKLLLLLLFTDAGRCINTGHGKGSSHPECYLKGTRVIICIKGIGQTYTVYPECYLKAVNQGRGLKSVV